MPVDQQADGVAKSIKMMSVCAGLCPEEKTIYIL